MIDREQPSRHFIVSKRNEITTIKQVTESIYTDDEVIFNALRYTIFETLKKKNIIFEGWADKRVFELITKTKKSKNISKFDELGRVHITGVKNIISITKVLELANREYFVISDSDYPAKAKRKSFQQEEQCNGIWLTYEDLVPDIYTLEDFIKHAAYKESIEAACSKHSELKDFDYSAFKSHKNKREQYIKNWIKSFVEDEKEVKTILFEIKKNLYSNLKATDIEDTYYDLLEKLKPEGII